MNFFMNIQSTFFLFFSYVILAVIVVFSSIYISKYVDALDKKTNLSGAFIGGVILAAVTSLPELFTSLTAISILNRPELVQGNVYGSNVFNLTIIAVCVLIAVKTFRDSEISKAHIGTLIFTIIMFILCFIGIYIPNNYTFSIIFSRISIISILIMILYIVNILMVKNDNISSKNEKNNINLTIKQIVIRFIFLAVLLVSVSILLTQVTDVLSSRLELGKTASGAVFLGVATSLPELTASINLVRLKNFNASIGNITGSNLFNFIILCFGDLLYNSGSIYNVNKEELVSLSTLTKTNIDSIILIVFSIISSILSIFILKFRKNVPTSIILAFALIVSYILSIVFSM